MALTKQTIVDKAETVKIKNYYCIQIRERIQILENGNEISATFHRYILTPDADVSKISDPVIKAQFEAVMTDAVKANYAKFLKEQAEQNKAS
tara:strand:- start:268 stop:543 length:276 start_codon:yes stop_codon:yes gene_type:complete